MKPLKFILFGFICLALLFVLSTPRPSFAQDCASVAPDAPNLYQATESSTSAAIYFVQPTLQFDSYIISYGLTQSADAYSTTFASSRLTGAVKYVINDLFPKTNYFFKVRAVNGCAAGAWSNTISTNVAGAGSLPETGPSNTFLTLGVGGLALVFVGVMGLLFLF